MIWALLVIYQFKHLLADYFLQGRYMLGKFKKYPDYIMPLLAHVGVHGAFTLVIAAAFHCPYAPWLALLDMTIHFVMDRIKASPDLLGRFQALSKGEYMEQMRRVKTLSDAPEPRHPEIQLALDNMQRDFIPCLKSNTYFWWSLGFDQMVHHLSDILVIYLIMRNLK